MLQHHKGKVGLPYSIKKKITPFVLDAELDSFEDFDLKRFWANKDEPFLVI